MVTCKLLGRTGNQCFIIAAVIGYAKKYGLEYHIPAHTQNDAKWKPMFTHLENKNYNPALPKIKIEERGFAYNHLPAPPFKDCNIELSGYFQSHKYFDHCIEDVREAFSLNTGENDITSEYLKVAIHIRLGDYKNLPECHPIITKEYLKAAMSFFATKAEHDFLLISDDYEEALKMIPKGFTVYYQPPNRTIYNDDENILIDLMTGINCDHIIGSNSSFSLWMYYLNQNPDKIGIFPKRWFGPKLNHDTKDLYPDNCIIL